MAGHGQYQPKNPILKWFERRLPVLSFMHGSFVAYPVPRNLNYWWTFGAILSFMLVVQIVTGIVLAMHYTPTAGGAFDSVEHIMRDVNYGWLLRYIHANGASLFFLAVYIHIFRGLYYGSYKEPREVLWILGVIIFVLMMAAAFMGYVLPWGQMSFWAATVITNLFTAIPGFGRAITQWLWGGYAVDEPTLQRFFALHYLVPFMIVGVVILHVWALHEVGQGNPAGIDVKSDRDTMPFTPYATAKDNFALVCFMILLAWFVFYIPNYLGIPPTTTFRRTRCRRRSTSFRNGTSCRFTRSCARSRTSCWASSRCSVRLPCSPSCPGSTLRRCARRASGRSTSSSSGCWWLFASGLTISAQSPPRADT